MSEPDDSTRPISVAELLARNGTIGSPPVAKRRRMGRRKSGGVSVAELTGEIPVIREDAVYEETAPADAGYEEAAYGEEVAYAEAAYGEEVAYEEASYGEVSYGEEGVGHEDAGNETADAGPTYQESVYQESVYEVTAYRETTYGETTYGETAYGETAYEESVYEETAYREAVYREPVDEGLIPDQAAGESSEMVVYTTTDEPVTASYVPAVERSYDPGPVRYATGAEQMAFDPVDESVDLADLIDEPAVAPEELRSYLRTSTDTLFSGQSVADDLARRGIATESDDRDTDDRDTYDRDTYDRVLSAPGQPVGVAGTLWGSAVAVLQSLLAVVFGAGLFIGFDRLWRWNNLVALMLSVLVVLTLAAAVRYVRKTEDIVSTLTAVAVGLLVTLGPLALQST